MRIVLCHMPDTPEGCVVGTLDGLPLRFSGRQALAGGSPVPNDDAFRLALYEAVEAGAGCLFGSEWSGPLHLLSGINRRACQKDRVRRDGLPPRILKALAWASGQDNPRAFGHFLLGARRLAEASLDALEKADPPELGNPAGDPEQEMLARVSQATLLVRWLLSTGARDRAAAALRKAARDAA